MRPTGIANLVVDLVEQQDKRISIILERRLMYGNEVSKDKCW